MDGAHGMPAGSPLEWVASLEADFTPHTAAVCATRARFVETDAGATDAGATEGGEGGEGGGAGGAHAGVATYANGDTYEGAWLGGIRHGQVRATGRGRRSASPQPPRVSRLVSARPAVATRGANAGQRPGARANSQGRYTSILDGSVHVGRYFEGQRNGRGREEFGNGDVYEGEYAADKPNGLGHTPPHPATTLRP